MADVIGAAVIEVTADASGVSAGIAQATQAVKAFEQAAVSSGTKAGAALTKATKDTSVTSAQLTREQERLISTIDRYSQTVGKTRGEVLELRAAQGGVTSQVQAQIAAIKQAEAAQAAAAQTAAKQAEAQRDLARAQREVAQAQTRKDDFVGSLRLQADSIGKTRSQLLELQAAQLGVTAQAAPFIARIRESEQALGRGGKELNKYGQSAAQTAAALRGVPAQVTDIVTSLQGGQAPLTVFLQQGGQLRDMFGGAVPAAKALGGALLGLINPFTVVAAAVVTLGVAYAQGSKETDEYRKALVLTGNVAGLTTAQLQIMARNIDASVGTQHQAAEALAAIAATGQVAGTDLEKFGATAVRINRTVGTSIEDTAKQFAELGKDPVKASEKLNESMNYLTLAVYDQIRAAQENGREQEAASIAQNAYADAMDKRTAKLEANLGIIQRAWRSVTDVAKEAWDEILGIGRPDGPGENAMPRWSAAALAPGLLLPGEIGRGLRGAFNNATTSDADREAAAETRRLAARSATAEATLEREQAITNKMQIEARKRLEEQKKATRSRAEQRADEIKQLDRDAKAVGLSAEEYNKRVANINEKYKDPKGPKAKEFQDDAATKYLMQLRETEASLKEQLTQSEKLTASQRELAKFEQQIADIKEKKTLTADQKSLLANQAAIEAQLKKNVAVEEQVEIQKKVVKELEKEKKQAEDFARAIQGINISIESSTQSRKDQQDRSLEAFGLGDRARQEVEAQRTIRNEYERYQRQLTKDAAEKNQLGSAAYLEEVEKIKGALNDALSSQQAYFDALKEKRENWINGATTALANYIDEINDASKRAQGLVTNTLGGITDGITGLLTGDKGTSFKDVGKRIVEQITRGIVEQQITKPIAEWLQGSLKDGDSLIGKFIGGLTSNKETGENWLGFLGLGGGKSKSSGGGLASVTSSSNTASTSLMSLAEAANQASFALGGTGGSGITGGGSSGFLDTLISGVAGAFGGFSNGAATSLANASGTGLDGLFRYTNNFSGRAFGGSANAGSIHEVNENGPELLTMGNRTFLMMGKESGNVTPLRDSGPRGDTYETHVHVEGRPDRGTVNQIANQTSLAQRQARRLA